jgi:hypothetical protein
MLLPSPLGFRDMRASVASYELPFVVSPPEGKSASLWFIHLGLIGCIILQRFCFYVAGAPISLCLPLFLGLAVWMLVTDRAGFRLSSVALFAAFAASTLIAALFSLNLPDPRIGSFSIASLIGLLATYAALTVRPNENFDPARTFGIFVGYVRLCAILGIAQYFLQFSGLRFFSFFVAFPALKPFLLEPLYNFQPVVAYGSSVMRSNGVFLLEPSHFSQLLMLGVAVDVFVRREWRFLPLYAFAYVLTYAGTGLVALAIACILTVLIQPRRSVAIAIFGVVALVFAVLAAAILPEQFGALTSRSGELNASGSSAYARYMTQFSVLDMLWGETRTLVGFGPGALDRAEFYTTGGGNPALKLFVDYGLIGLVAFAGFFVHALWRRDLAIVSLFVLVNFQLGGGNLMFAPLVVLGAILCIWSKSEDTDDEGDAYA